MHFETISSAQVFLQLRSCPSPVGNSNRNAVCYLSGNLLRKDRPYHDDTVMEKLSCNNPRQRKALIFAAWGMESLLPPGLPEARLSRFGVVRMII